MVAVEEAGKSLIDLLARLITRSITETITDCSAEVFLNA
jgi:hypothetical protein